MKNLSVVAVLIFVVCSSCGTNESNPKNTSIVAKDSIVGRVEIYDSSCLTAIDSNATIEVIGKNFTWSEGPLWIASKQMLLFTDVPENKIFQWKPSDSCKLYLTPSGYTGTVKRVGGEDGANGLAIDNEGRLLLCQSGNRQVVRLNTSLDSPRPDFTTLSASYNGKKFNSPNDLVVDGKSNIYFTDPIYGLPQRENDSTRELNFEGVYKINADGKTTLQIDTIQRPNGIALSLDEKTLYIASSDDLHPCWYAFSLDENGNVTNGKILLDGIVMKEKALVKQGADGIKIDKYGNIFGAGPDGINIISPDGKLIGLIKVFIRKTSNCAFNETKDVLYVTADDAVLKIILHPSKK